MTAVPVNSRCLTISSSCSGVRPAIRAAMRSVVLSTFSIYISSKKAKVNYLGRPLVTYNHKLMVVEEAPKL